MLLKALLLLRHFTNSRNKFFNLKKVKNNKIGVRLNAERELAIR